MLRYYAMITSFIFLLVALVHILKLAFGWKVMINDTELSNMVSFIAIAVFAILGAIGFKLAKKKNR